MKTFNFIVSNVDGEISVYNYLKLNNFSNVIILKVKRGGITVNERVAKTVDAVKNGDKISVTLPSEEVNKYATPLNFPLRVLYDDEYFLAVFKPSGMVTHNGKTTGGFSLENAVYYAYNNEFLFRPVNRLDKDTAGIVIIAKDAYSASLLGNIIKNGNLFKGYVGVLKGVPTKLKGEINAPIKDVKSGIKRVVASDGKPSITKYEVVKVLPNGNSLCKFNLVTGRTHQIRVHTAHIGNPLYADDLYGEKIDGETYNLTCNEIEFTHPFTNIKIKITATTRQKSKNA
ncbi:MAG: RluA family pseudouridine synthase [Clostridia bacterium]|nr:RluA family pseudouridine synthase [Clostridia bacterium]